MEKDFLGIGWKFPIQLDNNGKFALSKYEEDIKEAIIIILKTQPGERVMHPEFGCGINNYIFSIINTNNLLQIENEIKRALVLYEPRISIKEVKASSNESAQGYLNINIDYQVKSTNSRQSIVYPFYLREKG